VLAQIPPIGIVSEAVIEVVAFVDRAGVKQRAMPTTWSIRHDSNSYYMVTSMDQKQNSPLQGIKEIL
jgi:hypothetical protein